MSSMPLSVSRLITLGGGPAAMLGGTIWLLLWVHFLLTHGPTSRDYKETFLGLSYYDSTKLVVLALALCIVGLISLRARRPSSDWPWLGTLGYFLALPWGDTTRASTDVTKPVWIGIGVGSITAFLGPTLLGTSVVRANVLPVWAIVPLIIAGLASIP